MTPDLSERIARGIGITALICLIVTCAFTILPLLRSLAWAIVLVLTTWPIYRRLLRLGPKWPGMMALLMTVSLGVISFVAVTPMLIALSGEVEQSAASVQGWLENGAVDPPEWLTGLPVVGSRAEEWLHSLPEARARVKLYMQENSEAILGAASVAARRAGKGVFTFIICLVFCYFLYRHGMTLSRQVATASSRIGGTRFRNLIGSIRDTVRAAVYGAVLTAIVQGFLAGVGYMAAGAPVPILLGFFTMLTALLPFGAPLVYLPISLLVVANGSPPIYGILLAVWGLAVVSTVDNILRPMFISQTTSMPLGLSLIGVIGGLIQFGLLGIILGPVAFAAAHVLWSDWLAAPETPAA